MYFIFSHHRHTDIIYEDDSDQQIFFSFIEITLLSAKSMSLSVLVNEDDSSVRFLFEENPMKFCVESACYALKQIGVCYK